ncbi:MAG TPA: FtsX-like permease family protein [Candidatus Methylacidiphilales bacterium]|nr:FtsX-like permease family protein [Candidatus Methylacidiphilales bacterium]
MLRLFLVHSLRYFARHSVQTLLNVLGVALGITVFISIQIVNYSAIQSFRASVDVVAGRANLELTGEGIRFDETLYTMVRNHPDIASATPLVEVVVPLPDFRGEYLQVMGVDVFSNAPLRSYDFVGGQTVADPSRAMTFLSDPNQIALTEPLCRRLGLKLGDTLRVSTSKGPRMLKVAFLLKLGEDQRKDGKARQNDIEAGADEHLAVMDIATVQEVFGFSGQLSRILAIVREGASPERVAAELSPRTPANVEVRQPDRRGQKIERMVGAFQLNLTALSLVSLLVGAFLIYNTVATAVVRRRTEIGILRALGMTPSQVRLIFLAESLLQGLIGVALGIGLGIVLAGQLIGIVSKTISMHYILISIQQLFISPWSIVAAVGLGCLGVLIAAWYPATEASRVPIVQALHTGYLREKSLRHTRSWLLGGVAMLGLSVAVAQIALRWGPAWLSFGSALFLLLGVSFFVPPVCLALSELLRGQQVYKNMLLDIAVGHFGRSLHRNSITIAALVTAISMVVGISTMIFSFRKSVENWLTQSIQADVFLSPASSLIGVRMPIPKEVVEIAQKAPGVVAADLYREIRIQYKQNTVKLATFDFTQATRLTSLTVNEGPSAEILPLAAKEGHILVSESFSRRMKVKRGDIIPLLTTTGERNLYVAGTFPDYTSEMGLIIVDLAKYREWWRDDTVNSIALYADNDTSAQPIQDYLREKVAPYGEFSIFSNMALRFLVFRIFDQTFSVTYVLQTVGIVISALGIVLNLSILVTERRREIGLLRAAGASRKQVQAIILWEAGMIALVGAFLGIIAGLGLAAVLSYVINMSYFGWTITWATPWPFLLWLPVWVIAASIAAAYLPARKASKINIAAAVKQE